MINASPELQQEAWSQSIIVDARQKNPLADFIGAEDSGMPICEAKRAAVIERGQKIHFNTEASVGGQGVMGTTELKVNLATGTYGGFSLTVDRRRFGIGEEDLVAFFTNPGGAQGNREEHIYSLCSKWWSKTYADDMQIVLRNKALFAANQPNVVRIGNGATSDDLTLSNTFDTAVIEDSANTLMGLGAMPMSIETDSAGADVPHFMVYGMKNFLDPLKNEQRYREAVIAANTTKGAEGAPFTAKYPNWEGNAVFRNIGVRETGPVRQGTPLQPYALTGVAIANGVATSITGGGSYNTGGTRTNPILYDFFSYFAGFAWKTFSTESLPADSNTYYAIIYNLSGADKNKYEIVSYVAAGNNGNALTVIREINANGQKTALTAAGRYTNVHPSGSLVIPCNKFGVPIGYALHMGGNALMVGKGGIEAQKITQDDDFGAKKGVGIQTIIGYSPYTNTDGIFPNFTLIEGAVNDPRLNLVALN
jgi:hypothetical protein